MRQEPSPASPTEATPRFGPGRAVSMQEVQACRAMIDRIGRLSDGLLQVGGVKLGLDGILAWIPLLGEAYSLGAGGVLLAQGYKAHVPATALAKVAAIVAGRTLLTGVGETPIVGVAAKLAVDVLRGHRMSADILLRAIDSTEYVATTGAARAARARGRRVVLVR